jgi:CHAT domain-containing protein
MSSESKPAHFELCLEIIKASREHERCCALGAELCSRLDLDRVDFTNPMSCFLETAISQAFLAAYAMEDYRLALRFSEVADAVAARIPGFEVGRARTENNRALALMELGDFVDADALFQKAVKRLSGAADPFNLKGTIVANIAAMEEMRSTQGNIKIKPVHPIGIGGRRAWAVRNQVALQELASGRAAEARNLFLAVLADLDLDTPARATLLSNLASAEVRLGLVDEARVTLESAIKLCEDGQYKGQVLAGLLYEYSQLLTRNGGVANRNEDIERSLKQAWDIVRRVARNSRLSLLVLNSLARWRLAQRDFTRARTIVDRGIAIYDEMRASTGRTEGELSGLFAIFRQLSELRVWIAMQEETSLEVILTVQRAKGRYWSEVMRVHGDLAAPERDSEVGLKSEGDFGHLVGFEGTLLEFFVGPNATFVSVVHNKSISGHRIDVTEEELRRRVDDLRADLSSGLGARRSVEELSALLLSKVEVDWPSDRAIIVCPDGPLWRFPMSLLKFPSRQHALGDEAPCFCVPSAAVLSRIRTRPSTSGFPRALVVAHEGRPGRADRLGDASEEIRFVRSAFEPTGTTRMLGSHDSADGPATPEGVLHNLEWATHVHFLAHAAGGSEKRESRILLDAADGTQDFLSASRIQGLDLHAELIVLAACESSLGLASPGEGLASLGRAFLLAGARCVVATLWEVHDGSIREFFRLFYSAISRSESPARAYWLAKQAYEARFGRDDTSAALIMLGDGDAARDRMDLGYLLQSAVTHPQGGTGGGH